MKMFKTSDESIAVYVRDICFSYNKSQPILNGINLTVKTETICGLLGASGCGKTTLLKCILGRLKPKTGVINIFGNEPGSSESQIPGAGVGYMPQELSLYNEFTVKEILTYFGRIYGMKSNEIKEKVKELTKLLQLSDKNKLIGQHSGGQQRRISLSCALIHSPPLLILDEPTVGTDPLLRRDIWHHLVSLSNCGHTIIVTTHYIEEARNANTVAFMRSGKILAEDEPNLLLNKYESNNLEEVFLKLCELKNTETEDSNNEINCYENSVDIEKSEYNVISKSIEMTNIENEDSNNTPSKNHCYENSIEILMDESENDEKSNSFANTYGKTSLLTNPKNVSFKTTTNQNSVPIRKSDTRHRFSALLYKNIKYLERNIPRVVIQIIIFTGVILMVNTSGGVGPRHLNLAIYNGELIHNNSFGQIFIESIDENIFKLNYYNTIEEAIDSVKLGQNYGAIHINDNFTQHLSLQIYDPAQMSQKQYKQLPIKVHLDRSSQLVGLQIEDYLYETLTTFMEGVAHQLEINPDSLKLPLVLDEPPIYGDIHRRFNDVITPTTVLLFIFALSAATTSQSIYTEQKDGLIERNLVAGITAIDFLLSTLSLQFVLLCMQIMFYIIMSYVVLRAKIFGSLTLYITLIVAQGLCGIGLGLAISSILSDIIQIGLTVFFILMLIISSTGAYWPLEIMPYYLQQLYKVMPNTLPVQSLRDIMYRQWTIDYFEVYIGFVVTFVWFAIFILIAIIFLRKNL